MMDAFTQRIAGEIDGFRRDGVYKQLLYLEGPQAPRTNMEGHGEVIVLSSNNYLGLCNQPEVIVRGEHDDFAVPFHVGPGGLRPLE
ncbi:MAG: hypothetical protein SGJ01_18190, partial [Gemmatimonadota bacterium]|nr:hypothetical protein [Gemmatimonadota bacterium]